MASKFEVVLEASLSKQSINQIEAQLAQLSKTKINLDADLGSIKTASGSMKELSSATKNASDDTQTLLDKFAKFSQWQIVGDIVHVTKNAIADMVDNVFELDAALVEFNKVTDLSEKELKEFTEQAYEVAEAMGRTGTEAIDAATEFSKAGYKEQAADLAEIALLYQNIADEQVSTKDATALLVSQMKAFNIEAKDAITVIDQINEVDIRASRYRNVA